MCLKNPDGDVQESNGRHTSGTNKNSPPWLMIINQRDKVSGVMKVNGWKVNQKPFPRFQSEIPVRVRDLFICKSHWMSLKMLCPM